MTDIDRTIAEQVDQIRASFGTRHIGQDTAVSKIRGLLNVDHAGAVGILNHPMSYTARMAMGAVDRTEIQHGTMERLKQVERERDMLEQERDMLQRRLDQLKGAYDAQQVRLDLERQRVQDMSPVVHAARTWAKEHGGEPGAHLWPAQDQLKIAVETFRKKYGDES